MTKSLSLPKGCAPTFASNATCSNACIPIFPAGIEERVYSFLDARLTRITREFTAKYCAGLGMIRRNYPAARGSRMMKVVPRPFPVPACHRPRPIKKYLLLQQVDMVKSNPVTAIKMLLSNGVYLCNGN